MLAFMVLSNDFLNTRNNKSETSLTSVHQRLQCTGLRLRQQQSLQFTLFLTQLLMAGTGGGENKDGGGENQSPLRQHNFTELYYSGIYLCVYGPR